MRDWIDRKQGVENLYYNLNEPDGPYSRSRFLRRKRVCMWLPKSLTISHWRRPAESVVHSDGKLVCCLCKSSSWDNFSA